VTRLAALIVGATLVLQAGACTPPVKHPADVHDEPAQQEKCDPNGGLDPMEREWRDQLAEAAAAPPADHCDGVASDADPASNDGRADKVGRALFSVAAVVTTIGMAVAPYLLMM